MVCVYCEEINPRIQYTVDLIFSCVLGIEYTLTNSPDDRQKTDAVLINYSQKKIQDAIQIIPSGLLNETGIHQLKVKSGKWNNIPVLFADENKLIPFDLFSAVFYLVTRYEEYTRFNPDRHGRYEADQCIAWRKKFLHLPVVDLWCIELAKTADIYEKCPNVKPKNYRFLLTIDIDNAWIYKHKGLFLASASLFRSLLTFRFSEFRSRINVLLFQKKDPGDNYEYITHFQSKLSEKIKFFILCGKRGKFDTNQSLTKKAYQKLIHRLDKMNPVGIHPSYGSNLSFKILKTEYRNLSNFLNRKLSDSRQHFLKLQFPETYQNLIQLGISKDFSMGYSQKSGFRAGIARPFFYYDLTREKQTSLLIVPFQIMDRTLLTNRKFTTEEAVKEIEYYFHTVKNAGGTFVPVWHNTSLSNSGEWKGWTEVFEKMITLNKNP